MSNPLLLLHMQVHFGDLPLNITSFALSLLLVFRTDSSYSRWQEALCTWNHVRNYSKDLVRLTCYWVRNKQKKVSHAWQHDL